MIGVPDRNRFGVWESIVVSLVLTPFAIAIGLMSAGAGEGDYFLVKVLFPYTMLSTTVNESITTPFMILAVLQFPIYGCILALAANRGAYKSAAIILAAIHLTGVIICFCIVSEEFS